MTSLRSYRLLMAASVIVPAVLFVMAAVHGRAEAMRDGQANVARIIAVLNEHARKVFETGDLVLGRVDDRIRGLTWAEISTPEISDFLARLKAPLEQTVSVWVTDADGVVRAGSQAWNPGVLISEREFFRVQKDHDAGTYVSAAFRGKATATASIAVSRRRSTPDGHFDGTIHIALSPAYFARFFAEVEPALSHAALLARADGEILARDPFRMFNERLSPQSHLLQAMIRHPDDGAFTAKSSLDGVERIHAYRKIAGYPVYVVFGLDTVAALGRWQENTVMAGAATGVASLLLLLLSWLALRSVAAQQTAMAQLRQTMEDLQRETAQREAAEQRVREAQKMEAVGQLTGGIAHDFNNLLTAVLGSLQLLRKRLPKTDERAGRLLDTAVQGAERGAALTQRLLAFGRRQLLEPEAVDIPQLVRGITDLLRSSLGAGIQVETRFPITVAPALVDANQLEIALLNLAVNARDAMGGEGKLIIAAREEPGASPTGGYVVLSVIDTGTGMDEATLTRAMEPFFTTKGVGKGTGLGLSMVHGLAAQSDGRLVLHSRLGEGTTAELWLPRADTVVDVAPGRAGVIPHAPAAPSRVVLVVDDDALVLASSASMLEDMGHSVVEAASGRQALEILRAGAKVDLVMTDNVMPGMSGLQLAAELHRLYPALPVLLATGYAEKADVVDAGLPLLAKPFDQAAMADAIARCLDQHPNQSGQVLPFRRL